MHRAFYLLIGLCQGLLVLLPIGLVEQLRLYLEHPVNLQAAFNYCYLAAAHGLLGQDLLCPSAAFSLACFFHATPQQLRGECSHVHVWAAVWDQRTVVGP